MNSESYQLAGNDGDGHFDKFLLLRACLGFDKLRGNFFVEIHRYCSLSSLYRDFLVKLSDVRCKEVKIVENIEIFMVCV